jgi:hypothetical protein
MNSNNLTYVQIFKDVTQRGKKDLFAIATSTEDRQFQIFQSG